MAVYTSLPLNVVAPSDHDIVALYSSVSSTVVSGKSPVAGTVTPVISAILITAGAVSGNTAVTTPELATFVAVAPATLKKFSRTPISV